MTFLSPWSAIVAAGVAVPLLLLLYFLKLRREPRRIPSTLLWRQAFEDLQVNAPFQRLRWSWLLLLQLAVLALLLLAFARPALDDTGGPATRLILLVDHSASMQATDGAGGAGMTRLDDAKAAAVDIVNRLARSADDRQIMVVAFGADAQVVRGFTGQRQLLVDAIGSIQPTDETADLDRALQLAGAFAATGEEAADRPPAVTLISDGGVGRPRDPAGFRLRAGEFTFVAVGPQPDNPVNNLGIATFSARRDYDDPTRVLLFARLVNASPQAIDTVVTLSVDGEPTIIRRITVPAATVNSPGDNDTVSARSLGEAPLSLTIELPGAAILTLRHSHLDALPTDDVAGLIMAERRRPRVAVIHRGDGVDPFLHDAIAATEPASLRALSTETFAALPGSEVNTAEAFDLIVFDRVSPQRLPGVPTMTIGGVPAGISTRPPATDGGRRILSWDRQHALMRHVALDTIRFRGFGGYELPVSSLTLATGPEGPVIALLRTRGARHVLVGFALEDSNWPLHVSFTVFLQNALNYLTTGGPTAAAAGTRDAVGGMAGAGAWGQAGMGWSPGQALTVRARPEASELTISGPQEARIAVDGGMPAVLPVLRRVGVYNVEGAVEPMDQVALSLLSDGESNIQPRSVVTVNAEAAAASRLGAAAPLELWPWLVGAALVLLVTEWLVYCRLLAA